jgi:hypothetical protein
MSICSGFEHMGFSEGKGGEYVEVCGSGEELVVIGATIARADRDVTGEWRRSQFATARGHLKGGNALIFWEPSKSEIEETSSMDLDKDIDSCNAAKDQGDRLEDTADAGSDDDIIATTQRRKPWGENQIEELEGYAKTDQWQRRGMTMDLGTDISRAVFVCENAAIPPSERIRAIPIDNP